MIAAIKKKGEKKKENVLCFLCRFFLSSSFKRLFRQQTFSIFLLLIELLSICIGRKSFRERSRRGLG